MKLTRFLIIFLYLIFFYFQLVFSEEIKDSESASHDNSAARYNLVDTYEFPGFQLIQYDLPVLSIYSYILTSGNEALIIDPERDITYFLNILKKKKLKLKGVYLSHSHADFIAGHMEFVKKLKTQIYQSYKSGAGYPFKPLKEGSEIWVGKTRLRFIETPGHTPDGMCAMVFGSDDKSQPELLLTGDVLFVGSVGRPDLIGGSFSAAWLASALFDSWTNKISKLGDSVRIFPAHGAGSLCGAHLSDEPSSTIGNEKVTNPYLKYRKRGEFIAAVLDGIPEAPGYFKHNAAMNKKGPPLIKWNGKIKNVRPSKHLTNPDKYYVVDVRNAKSYAEGHIPGSLNIAVRGRIETWTGIMVPWKSNLVITGQKKEIKEAVKRLHRIGYKAKTIEYNKWKKSGLKINRTPAIKPSVLYRRMQEATAPVIVDVRLPSEWMGMRIGTVLNLPLNKLSGLSMQLDPNEEVVTVCNSAFRSSLAVGILERKGFKHPVSLQGGSQAWINQGFPVFKKSSAGIDFKAIKAVNLPERISPSDLKRMIMDLPGTFDLVDIRPPEYFKDYHIPGSQNIDINHMIDSSEFLTGNGPLIIADRDGTISMAVGGIISQKTKRLIKVLYGGVDAYWSENESGLYRDDIINSPTQTLPKNINPPSFHKTDPNPIKPELKTKKKKRKSAGC